MRALGVYIIAVSLVVGGCAFTSPYPPDWPPVAEEEHGRRHHIEGRYLNAGVSEGGYCSPSGSVYTLDCDIDLSSNILSGRPSALDRGRASRWVEFKQPDDNTLVIELDDRKAPIILKQSDGDFTIGSDGLTVSQSGSGYRFRHEEMKDWEVIGATTAGAIIGTGSLDTISRSFRRLKDGSLLMKVKESHAGGILAIPFYFSTTQHIRWSILPPNAEGKPSPQ